MRQTQLEKILREIGQRRREQREQDEANFYHDLSESCKFKTSDKYHRRICSHEYIKESGRLQNVLLYCHFTNCPFINGRV